MEQQGTARVGVDAITNKVFLELNGKPYGMFWQDARLIAAHLLSKAAEAEQIEKNKELIADGAIMHKAGVPIGVSNLESIKKEVKKEAQWGIGRKVESPNGYAPSGEVVGIPGFHATPPKDDTEK